MSFLKNSILLKVLGIGLLVLILLIPSNMIENLVHERQGYRTFAMEEVFSKWASEQTVSGPFLSIPYTRREVTGKLKEGKMTEEVVLHRGEVHILPETLDYTGTIVPEIRHQGIYEVVVYRSNLRATGTFNLPDLESLGMKNTTFHTDEAVLTLGLSDLRGVEGDIRANWNNKNLEFNSGVTSNNVVNSGIHSPAVPEPGQKTTFDINLKLRGSAHLYFTPLGKSTNVKLSSSWKAPSFTGAFLPERNINESGFTATWNVGHLNRNFPQIWRDSEHHVGKSAFGVDLMLPVDNYQKTIRSIKYALMFIGLTFTVFFFVEILNRVNIHPIQYLLVGLALVIFYSLLLSLGEHIPFNLAFWLSAAATIFTVTGYVRAFLKSVSLTALIFSVLLILYGFIFTLIQLEDYALLFGSIGIFMILAAVMYFSRKIDWYNLPLQRKAED